MHPSLGLRRPPCEPSRPAAKAVAAPTAKRWVRILANLVVYALIAFGSYTWAYMDGWEAGFTRHLDAWRLGHKGCTALVFGRSSYVGGRLL